MKAKLYGIGTGPGDPELLTLKAIKTIELCDVIAIPSSESTERTAFLVVEQYLTGKELLECRFSMSRNEEQRVTQREIVAGQICNVMQSGKSVGMITLGDPTIYSTFRYVRDKVGQHGFDAEIVPGVTSFSAAAAALDISLCEGNEPLHIIPAGCSQNIEPWLELPGTKVIMKSGKNMRKVLETLEQRGLSKHTKIVSRCTMSDEQVFESIEAFYRAQCNDTVGYFSVIIVKGNRK